MFRDALRNPDRFFRERTPKLAFPQTLAVVFFVALATTASVGVVLFYFAVRNATLDGNVAALAEQIRSLTATTTGGNVLLSALVTVWQWFIRSYGLKHARNLPISDATVAADVVALFSFDLSLLGSV